MELCTDCVLVESLSLSLEDFVPGREGSLDLDGEKVERGEERISDFREESFSDSAACSFESSAATRCWMWRSRVLARVEFVC